ncbi:GDSL-type esterase/lipase family protein [Clostridium algoriphilum]|uniref:GDSL-type esterase/lipase family protein n=1 Tax=Clostridium algoriphilum TaxID=198347 RepID=UPI001CF2F196|nr:GDSL-type esterase/lipase family protein [Clostridium algoriphilum]MCB2294250.1 GDSL-type esterase/lipase family protein [Clostridium algoriphilum]
MSIVCIGDSLTFGYGVNDSDNWVSIVSERVKNKIINKGVPGDTTRGMKERFINDVVNYKPSKVLIMGGTNDIFTNTSMITILNNIKNMVEVCETNNIVPIILTPLPVKENLYIKLMFVDMNYKKVNERLVELRKLLLQYGKDKNINSIDLGNLLPKNINLEEYFLEDGIHVSKEIHKEMAEIIYKGMLSL